jgi:hypothetical protein
MSEVLTFMGDHPIVTVLLAWCVAGLAYKVARLPYLMLNRWLRHRNIVAHGWPTHPLMDADGDIVHPPKEDAP